MQKQTKVAKVMKEFKAGTLKSGSKSGPKVTSPKQAIAIGLSEQRNANKKPTKGKGDATRSRIEKQYKGAKFLEPVGGWKKKK